MYKVKKEYADDTCNLPIGFGKKMSELTQDECNELGKVYTNLFDFVAVKKEVKKEVE